LETEKLVKKSKGPTTGQPKVDDIPLISETTKKGFREESAQRAEDGERT